MNTSSLLLLILALFAITTLVVLAETENVAEVAEIANAENARNFGRHDFPSIRPGRDGWNRRGPQAPLLDARWNATFLYYTHNATTQTYWGKAFYDATRNRASYHYYRDNDWHEDSFSQRIGQDLVVDNTMYQISFISRTCIRTRNVRLLARDILRQAHSGGVTTVRGVLAHKFQIQDSTARSTYPNIIDTTFYVNPETGAPLRLVYPSRMGVQQVAEFFDYQEGPQDSGNFDIPSFCSRN